jgi:hypothetical protein
MGRNKELKKKIGTIVERLEEHEEKIRKEEKKDSPDERLIEHWRAEIDSQHHRLSRLARRLIKEWQ